MPHNINSLLLFAALRTSSGVAGSRLPYCQLPSSSR